MSFQIVLLQSYAIRGFHPSGCLENFSLLLSLTLSERLFPDTLQQNLPFHILFFQCNSDTPPIKTLVLLLLCQFGDTVWCYVASKARSEKQYNFCLSLNMLAFGTQPPWCRIPDHERNTHTHFLVDHQLRAQHQLPDEDTLRWLSQPLGVCYVASVVSDSLQPCEL